MKASTLLFSLFCLMLSGCIKDHTTRYTATIHNNSGTTVTLIPYENGVPRLADSTVLRPGDSLEIANGWEWGEVKAPFFYSDFLNVGTDGWIKVVYNDSFTVLHLVNRYENQTGQKAFLFDHPRNVLGKWGYVFTHMKNGKSWHNHHVYRFMPEDYAHAKE